MGYVPPALPPNVSKQLTDLYRVYSVIAPDLGDSPTYWVHPDLSGRTPRTPYQRYLHDLYGDPSFNWFPVLNALAVILPILLVLTVIFSR